MRVESPVIIVEWRVGDMNVVDRATATHKWNAYLVDTEVSACST